MGNWQDVLTAIGTLILMIADFVGAYYASKFVGRTYRPRHAYSKNLTIIDSTPIGRNSSLLIIKVAGKVMLIGVTAQGLSMLSELDADQFEDVPGDAEAPGKDFASAFKEVLKSTFRKPGEGENK